MKALLSADFIVSWQDYPTDLHNSIVVYMYGCVNDCPGCHNAKFLAEVEGALPEESVEHTVDSLMQQLREVARRNMTKKIVLQGGDPLAPINIEFTKELLKRGKDEFDFCVYTGHDIKHVIGNNGTGFEFLKTGKYLEKLSQDSGKTGKGMTFASKNQKLWNSKLELVSTNGFYKFRTEAS